MLALLATYAVLLVCWSFVMRRHALRAARAGAQPEVHARAALDAADPWAEPDAAVEPAGPPRGTVSAWRPASS